MQALNHTSFTFLTFGLFFWLLVFLGAAWAINKLLKRKVVNGALFFLGAGALFFVIQLVGIARSPLGPEGVGALIGAYLLPALLGVYLARNFDKQKKTQQASDMLPNPTVDSDARKSG